MLEAAGPGRGPLGRSPSGGTVGGEGSEAWQWLWGWAAGHGRMVGGARLMSQLEADVGDPGGGGTLILAGPSREGWSPFPAQEFLLGVPARGSRRVSWIQLTLRRESGHHLGRGDPSGKRGWRWGLFLSRRQREVKAPENPGSCPQQRQPLATAGQREQQADGERTWLLPAVSPWSHTRQACEGRGRRRPSQTAGPLAFLPVPVHIPATVCWAERRRRDSD